MYRVMCNSAQALTRQHEQEQEAHKNAVLVERPRCIELLLVLLSATPLLVTAALLFWPGFDSSPRAEWEVKLLFQRMGTTRLASDFAVEFWIICSLKSLNPVLRHSRRSLFSFRLRAEGRAACRRCCSHQVGGAACMNIVRACTDSRVRPSPGPICFNATRGTTLVLSQTPSVCLCMITCTDWLMDLRQATHDTSHRTSLGWRWLLGSHRLVEVACGGEEHARCSGALAIMWCCPIAQLLSETRRAPAPRASAPHRTYLAQHPCRF